MKKVISVRPHSYKIRFDKVMNNQVFAVSVFDRRYTSVAKDLDRYEKWLKDHKSKNEGKSPNPTILGQRRFNTIFAEL
jgi:hypothetical protein